MLQSFFTCRDHAHMPLLLLLLLLPTVTIAMTPITPTTPTTPTAAPTATPTATHTVYMIDIQSAGRVAQPPRSWTWWCPMKPFITLSQAGFPSEKPARPLRGEIVEVGEISLHLYIFHICVIFFNIGIEYVGRCIYLAYFRSHA